jgi:hypothetical protein
METPTERKHANHLQELRGLPAHDVRDFSESYRLLKPLKVASTVGLTIVIPLIPTALYALVARSLHGRVYALECLCIYFLIAWLMSFLLREVNDKRRRRILRYNAFADINHHVRNALQSLVAVAYLTGNTEIKIAAARIELALRDVLPCML